MTTTLFDLKRKVHEILEEPYYGVATGGTNNTLLDANMINAPTDDFYNGGTLYIVSANNGSVCDIISDWADTNLTFTLQTTQSAVYASGDTYTAFTDLYLMRNVEKAVNNVITNLPETDLQALDTTVANQMAYDYPSNGAAILRLEIATSKTSPYDYKIHRSWETFNDGTNDQIVFMRNTQPATSGYRIRFTYRARPSALSADSDILSDFYNADWVAAQAALKLVSQRLSAEEGGNAFTAIKFQEIAAMAGGLAVENVDRPPKIMKEPTIGGWGLIN